MALPVHLEVLIQKLRAAGRMSDVEEVAFRASMGDSIQRSCAVAVKPVETFTSSPGTKWLGKPKPDQPLHILYACTQRPGYGGASTESYEAIKALRARGHAVTGLFLDQEPGLCDPDRIGNLRALPYGSNQTNPAIFDGEWHIIVGKMFLMGLASAKQNVPSVYITSGVSRDAAGNVSPWDQAALLHARRVIVHSTLDLEFYRKYLPEEAFQRIVPEVVRTSALAAKRPVGSMKPLHERQWDVCFSASDWRRNEKGGHILRGIGLAMGSCLRICACGDGLAPMLPGNHPGLVPHARMLEIMADSRVVVIPSTYDSSPNVYIEAALAGCNIVVSPAVGNIEGHPPELLAPEPTVEAFLPCVARAVKLDHQLRYAYETPEGAVERLEFWLRKIAEDGPCV
jgi:hypothetical protein